MQTFLRLLATRRPITLLAFLIFIINVAATGTLRNWLHLWRWPIFGFLTILLTIQIAANYWYKKQSREITHA